MADLNLSESTHSDSDAITLVDLDEQQNTFTCKAIEDNVKLAACSLASDSLSVSRSFCTVASNLTSVIPDLGPSIKDETIRCLPDKWETLHTTFDDLLWESQTVAVKAISRIDDFTGDFLTYLRNPNVPLESKIENIRSYCQGVQEDSKAADSLKRDFTRLRRQVKTFAESWAQGITRNGDALSKEIQKLLDDIKVTQDGLTWSNIKIGAMTVGGVLGIVALCLITKLPATKCLEIVRNVTSCDGLKAGTEVLVRDVSSKLETSLTPSEQAAAFASVGLHAIKNEWDNGVAEAQKIREKEREVEYLHACKTYSAKTLTEALEKCQTDLDNVVSKLGIFVDVWTALYKDLHAIECKLKASAVECSASELFGLRLDTLGGMYALLRAGLDKYASACIVE